MKILNITQHNATPEQIAAGVVEPSADFKAWLKELLTIERMPSSAELEDRAHDIAEAICFNHENIKALMIGGAPFLMHVLADTLKQRGFFVYYAFSQRVSKETTSEKGEVVKTNVFKHLGFVVV